MVKARIEIIAGAPPKTIEIPAGGLEIGRAVSTVSSVPIDAPSLSKRHAHFFWWGDDLLVEDIGSRNGVLREGARISGPTLLADGDELVLGDVVLRVAIDEPGFGAPVAQLIDTAHSMVPEAGEGDLGAALGRRTATLLPVVESFFHIRDARELAVRLVGATCQTVGASRAALLELGERGDRYRVLGVHGAKDAHFVSRSVVSDAVRRGVTLYQLGAMMGRATPASLAGSSATSAAAVAVRSSDRIRVLYADATITDLPRLPRMTWQHALEMQLLGSSAASAFDALAQRARETDERLRFENLRRHFSPAAVEHLHMVGREHELGEPRVMDATVLFADLAGFVDLADRMRADAASVVAILDRWLEHATRTVFGHEGALDKFMGDTVMAVFGAPLPAHNAALQATRCAFALQQVATDVANLFSQPLEATITMNTGPVLSCAIGPRRHREYTVLGDTVSVAARLREAAPRGVVVVSDSTSQAVSASADREPGEPLALPDGRSVPTWRLTAVR